MSRWNSLRCYCVLSTCCGISLRTTGNGMETWPCTDLGMCRALLLKLVLTLRVRNRMWDKTQKWHRRNETFVALNSGVSFPMCAWSGSRFWPYELSWPSGQRPPGQLRAFLTWASHWVHSSTALRGRSPERVQPTRPDSLSQTYRSDHHPPLSGKGVNIGV